MSLSAPSNQAQSFRILGHIYGYAVIEELRNSNFPQADLQDL
jgi:hypothetical protein